MKTKAEAMKDLAKVRRRTIVIQRKEMSENALGDPIEMWSDWRIVRAERSSLWGADYYAAAALGQEQTVEFTLRHVAFLDALNTIDYRLLYEGQTYDIKQIDLLQDDGMWIKLRALGRDK